MTSQEFNPIDRLIDIATGRVEPEGDDMEQRGTRRHGTDAWVALVQITPSGGRSIPVAVRCKNISAGGMCIVSRYMLHVGYQGAILMRRSDGELVLIGVRVVHCSYVGKHEHESGIEFTPDTGGIEMSDFEDETGELPCMEPREAA